MTDQTPTPVDLSDTSLATTSPASTTNPFNPAAAKKGYAGGVAGAAVAFAALNFGPLLSSGQFDWSALGADIGAVVTGFVVGFFAAWVPKNKA